VRARACVCVCAATKDFQWQTVVEMTAPESGILTKRTHARTHARTHCPPVHLNFIGPMESEGKKKRNDDHGVSNGRYFLHHIGWRVLLPPLPPTDSAQDRRMLSEHTQAGSSSFLPFFFFFFFFFSFPSFFSLSPLPAAARRCSLESRSSAYMRPRTPSSRRHN